MKNKIHEERKKLGLCVYCGKVPARENKTSCQSCSDKICAKQKNKRAKNTSHGLCSICGVYPTSKGMKTCERCRGMKRDSKRKSRSIIDCKF